MTDIGNGDTDALAEKPWFVYLLLCRGGRLYAGVTPDLLARMRKHRAGTGAKFTRAHPPESLLAAKRFSSRASALSTENQIKRLSASQKRDVAAMWSREFDVGDEVRALFLESSTGQGS